MASAGRNLEDLSHTCKVGHNLEDLPYTCNVPPDTAACLLPAANGYSLQRCCNQVVAGHLPNSSAAPTESRCFRTATNRRRHPTNGTGGRAA